MHLTFASSVFDPTDGLTTATTGGCNVPLHKVTSSTVVESPLHGVKQNLPTE